jgi:hypothetical protein
MILECGCPEHYPDWDGEDVDLGGQQAHILSIPTLMHMPLAYEAYMARQQTAIDRLQLKECWPGLVLTRMGMFRGSLIRLLEPTTSPARHIVLLPRDFHVYAVLHHGNVSTARKVIREMQMKLVDAGRLPKEVYLCHITCGRCSEKRGGEKILVLRRWVESPLLQKRIRQRQ